MAARYPYLDHLSTAMKEILDNPEFTPASARVNTIAKAQADLHARRQMLEKFNQLRDLTNNIAGRQVIDDRTTYRQAKALARAEIRKLQQLYATMNQVKTQEMILTPDGPMIKDPLGALIAFVKKEEERTDNPGDLAALTPEGENSEISIKQEPM